MATSQHSHQVPLADVAVAPRRERPRPQLSIVPDAVRRRRRAGVLASVLFGLLFTAMVSLVAFQAQLAANQLQLDQVEKDIRDSQLRFDRNRLQLALAQSPQVILERASALGMVDAGRTTYASSTPDAVTAVLKSVGAQAAEGVSQTRADWSEFKRIMGS